MFKRTTALIATLIAAIGLSACTPKLTDKQATLKFASDQQASQRQLMLDVIGKIKGSGVNNILTIEAQGNDAIVIKAKSLTVNQPVDLEAVFNSYAFQSQFGDLFPKTTNGWDAFIAFLGTAERIAGSPVPWLAAVLRESASQSTFDISGDGNAVADGTRSDTLDSNNQTDNSDNSDNSTPFIEPAIP